MSLSYDFEKNIILGLIATTITLIVGLVLIAHGQTTNETESEKHGTLMKHKGDFYCYDETTTTKKDVLDAIKNDWIDTTAEIDKYILEEFAKDNVTEAEEYCQDQVAGGLINSESYLDKGLELDGTLTLDFK